MKVLADDRRSQARFMNALREYLGLRPFRSEGAHEKPTHALESGIGWWAGLERSAFHAYGLDGGRTSRSQDAG